VSHLCRSPARQERSRIPADPGIGDAGNCHGPRGSAESCQVPFEDGPAVGRAGRQGAGEGSAGSHGPGRAWPRPLPAARPCQPRSSGRCARQARTAAPLPARRGRSSCRQLRPRARRTRRGYGPPARGAPPRILSPPGPASQPRTPAVPRPGRRTNTRPPGPSATSTPVTGPGCPAACPLRSPCHCAPETMPSPGPRDPGTDQPGRGRPGC
jgi:hypothetical protein